MSPNKGLIQKISISPDMPIIDAAQRLNDTHRQILLVVDDENHLLGIITDPDIRRGLLNSTKLSEPVSKILRSDPVVALEGKTPAQMLKFMKSTGRQQIPIVTQDNKVTDISFLSDFLTEPKVSEPAKRTAMIMAGGLGTRLRPLTNDVPKPMLKVGEKPILFSIIDLLLEADFDKIYVSVNYKKRHLTDAISNQPQYLGHVEFVEESKRLGTAGALSLVANKVNSPLLVLNGDLLTELNFDALLKFHELENNAITIGLRRGRYRIPYGVANMVSGRITSLDEKPQIEFFLNAGVYVLEPEILKQVPADTYYDMPELINEICSEEGAVGGFPIHEYWMDIGVPSQLAEARDYALARDNEKKEKIALKLVDSGDEDETITQAI